MINTQEIILKDLSIENAYRHMDFLVNEIGERLSGSEKLKKAAEYIKNELVNSGVEAKIDNFYMYHSNPVSAELRITYPETRVIAAEPVCHIASTLPEGLEGELIYARDGGYDDYIGKDVSGKIVLTDMTWSPGRPEKARIAWERGAKALIIMNWGPKENNPVIQMGGVKSQWGNPTPESFKEIPQIPVISVTRAAGEYLEELCKDGDVRVWLRAEATREWVTAYQPTGIIRVNNAAKDFILISSHIDAWGKTAICNSSGNALLLELARVFAKYKDKLNRNIVFTFWDGHEIAECAGSTWFVDNHWDKLVNNCIAYINVDNLAIKGTTIPGVESVLEVKNYIMNMVNRVWNMDGKWTEAHKGGGDSSFFGTGVPYIHFATEYTEEKLMELNYAFYSPWLHSNDDTVDKIDKGLYKKHMNFFASLAVDLCNKDIIPYEFDSVADDIRNKIIELKKLGGKKVDNIIGSLDPGVDDFARMISVLTEYRQKINEYLNSKGNLQNKNKVIEIFNKTLLRIRREISPILRLYSGKYGQDPCCYVISEMPIPFLYVPIKKLIELDNESEEYKLWETKLLKEKNKMYDALNNSIEFSYLAFELIDKVIEDN